MVAEDMIIFDNFRHTMTISAGVRIDEFPDLGRADLQEPRDEGLQ